MSPKRGDRATIPPPADEWKERTVWLIYASFRHPKDTDS